MAQGLPSPWPGAYTAPTLKTSQVAQGVLTGTTVAALNEIVQVEKGLVWFNPQVAPLLRISTKLKNPRAVENARFYHLEKQRMPRTAQIASVEDKATADHDTLPTNIVFDSGDTSKIRPNDLLYNTATHVIFLVSAINPDGDNADEVSGVANIGTAAPSGALWADNHVCVNIGSAYLDGSAAGSPIHVIEDEKIFYTQIFKDSIDQSDRYQKTALYEGDPWTNARKQCEQEHLLSIEHAMFFGKPSITRDSTTGKLRTTMGGLQHYVSTNVVDMDGDSTTTKAFFDSVMNQAMREGASGFENKELATKSMFCSQAWLQALNALAEAQIRICEPSEKTFGLRIAQYQGAWGVLNLINAPVLNRAQFQGEAYVLDMEHVRPANFKGRDTKWNDNIQDNDVDSRKGTYLSDKSMVLEVAPAHTRLKNLVTDYS